MKRWMLKKFFVLFLAAGGCFCPLRAEAEPISLSVMDGDVRSVLLSTARMGGFNLVLDDSVAGTVTVSLQNVEPLDAMHLVASAGNLLLEQVGGNYVVTARGNQAGLSSAHVFPLRYADPEEVRIDFSQPTSVWCRVTHAFLDEIAPIRFYDAKSGKVGLGRPATYAVSPGDVYWFENVFEALDAPGEWYLDETTGTLYYVPFEGETAADLTLYAPASPYLLEIDGCNGLSFENIRFFGSEWTLSVPPHDGGVRDQYNIDAYQASTECDAAVNIQNADGIRFVNCEFTDIGNTALRFIKNCHDCTVTNSLFRRVGSTAVAVYGENVAPDAENAAEAMSGFHILNNLVEA